MTLLLAIAACGPAPAQLLDANNALVGTDLQVRGLSSAVGSDILLDWSELETDLMDRPMHAEAVDRVELLIFNRLSQDQVIEGLEQDTLVQTDLLLYQSCEPHDSSCLLSEFGLHGSTAPLVESFVDDGHTWLLVLSESGAAGTRELAFLEPRAGGEETVFVGADSSHLELDADLGQALKVRSGVDWSELTVDVQGHPLSLLELDRARLGRFELPVEELQARLPELEQLAVETWTMDIEGRASLELSELSGPRQLHTLDADSTWLLSLECSTCALPLPRALTLLEAP